MITPYSKPERNKKVQVEEMFDSIARHYDFLNHLLSPGSDRSWRKRVIKMLQPDSSTNILDVATGTGDFALEALTLNLQSVIGIDLSNEMFSVGREKVLKRTPGNKIILQEGDAENLSFVDETFDAFTVSLKKPGSGKSSYPL